MTFDDLYTAEKARRPNADRSALQRELAQKHPDLFKARHHKNQQGEAPAAPAIPLSQIMAKLDEPQRVALADMLAQKNRDTAGRQLRTGPVALLGRTAR